MIHLIGMIQFRTGDSFYRNVTNQDRWFIQRPWYKFWEMIHSKAMILIGGRDSFLIDDINLHCWFIYSLCYTIACGDLSLFLLIRILALVARPPQTPCRIFSWRAYSKHGILTGQSWQNDCAILEPEVVVGKKSISLFFTFSKFHKRFQRRHSYSLRLKWIIRYCNLVYMIAVGNNVWTRCRFTMVILKCYSMIMWKENFYGKSTSLCINLCVG